MHPFRLTWLAAAVLLAAPRGDATAAANAALQHPGRVCGNPARPCAGFEPHDLSFVLPRGGTARAEARSDTFYAVILRSAPACSIPEDDRAATQALFPGRKVFSQRFECDGEVENNVTYTNVSPGRAFLALYAGSTREQGAAILATVERNGRFPGANLRRMRVVYVYP